MRCEELLVRLNDIVDGDLERDAYGALQAHLAECSPCEIVVDNIRQTITLYEAGQPAELPSELQQQLRQMLRAQWEAMFPRAAN